MASVVCIAALSLLVTAALLEPSAEGFGTHQQLGLAPCGFLAGYGLPCVTCGMTTAFAWAADGHLFTAFHIQPMGALLCVLTAITVIITGWAAMAGMPLKPLVRAVWRLQTFVVFTIGLILAWTYKILIVMT